MATTKETNGKHPPLPQALSPQPVRAPHVVLIDDDPLFTEVMVKVGSHLGIEMTVCKSMKDLTALCVVEVFDVAIVDFYLDGVRENLRGTDLAELFRETPVVLISRSGAENTARLNSEWPKAVKAFVRKDEGPDAILRAALSEWNSRRLRLLA